MSMDTCKFCGNIVDTDEDLSFYDNDECACEHCRDKAEEAAYYAELERGYAQDRI